MKKIAYLIGGLMINDNYGDVIQAKTWIDYYKKSKDIDIVLVCYESGRMRIAELFPRIKLESYESLMDRLRHGQHDGIDFFHMYGGGYLNRFWGSDFLNLMVQLKKHRIPMIVTCVQIDEDFHRSYEQKIGTTPANFRWVSFRDKRSRSLMNEKAPYIFDGSFFHFKKDNIRNFFYRKSNLFPQKAFVQISLNEYMYDNYNEAELVRDYRKLIDKIQKKYTIDFYSSFDKDQYKVKEGEYLYRKLNLNLRTKFLSVINFANRRFELRGYAFAIVNSYHTYIVARAKLSCPVYFLAFNDFYKQKAEALIEYGILNEKHRISSLAQLNTITLRKSKLSKTKLYDKAYSKMFKEADRIKKEVRGIITQFIQNNTHDGEKLKICFITPEYYSGGGIATYINITSRELKRLDADVSIITIDGCDKSYTDNGVTIEGIGNIRHSIINRIFLRFARILRIEGIATFILVQVLVVKRFMKLNKQKSFDVVEMTDYGGIGAILVFMHRFFYLKTRFLLRLHSSNLVMKDYYQIKRDLRYIAQVCSEYIGYKFADRIASPSLVLKEISKKYTKKTIDHIPYIVDVKALRSKTDKYTETSNKNYSIVFPGRIQDGKGVIIVVKAVLKLIEQYPEISLKILGTDTDSSPVGGSMKEYLLDIIPQKELHHFKFLGFIPRKYLSEIIHDSAFAVIPSIYDNYPYAALEVMTAGRAIIGSSKTGVEEMVKSFNCGLVFTNSDINDLVEKIKLLLDDTVHRNKLGRNGYNAVNKYMNTEELSKNYYRYLLSILE